MEWAPYGHCALAHLSLLHLAASHKLLFYCYCVDSHCLAAQSATEKQTLLQWRLLLKQSQTGVCSGTRPLEEEERDQKIGSLGGFLCGGYETSLGIRLWLL